MVQTMIDPRDERARTAAARAPRLPSLAGKTVVLLDISKPGGAVFLDRIALLLARDYGVTALARETKPTFAKPAPEPLLARLRSADAVIEGLAD
jgi:hypothetical protein